MPAVLRSAVRRGLVLLLALIASSGGLAQTSSPFGRSSSEANKEAEKIFGKYSAAGGLPENLFFEGPVNPDEYFVGPGDQLAITFWQPSYQQFQCVVSAEGQISVPLVGEFSVSGMTLTQTKSRIAEEIARALRVGRATISLVQPRRFRVHVTGSVANPGTYAVPATARVADAVQLAGGLQVRGATPGVDTSDVIVSSLRHIEILDRDGKAAGRSDLLLFQRAGRLDANPVLLDGQTIVVHFRDYSKDQIGVFGGVYSGGLFEYVAGDHLRDALALAGGLTRDADSSAVTVVSRDGVKRVIDLRGSRQANGLSELLQPGDRVHLTEFPDASRNGTVEILGEIARPGGYPIVAGETSLRQALETAGGVLPGAALNSARLIRHETQDLSRPERRRVMATGSAAAATPPFPSDPGLAAEFRRWDYGTVVVDLSAAGEPGSKAGELKLHDGDVIEIPKSPLGVRVFGAVNQAGEVAWKPGGTLNYYVSEAGGTNKGGWKGRAVVIKARNGSQIRYQSSLPIDPGDIIYIPSKQEITSWDQFKDIVGVVAQVATVVLIVQNLKVK